jgi:Transposase DDE domain
MSKSLPKQLTDPARFFLEPSSPTHRQYEALRAYFVEGLPSAEAAARFGYTPGSFRVLCHQFRHNTDPQFFAPVTKGPQTSPKSDPLRERIIQMRKQNFSIYDISLTLREAGTDLSPASISVILKEEGFARLPRRGDEERAGAGVAKAATADCDQLDLSPRRLRTKFGGIFLFLPDLASLPFDRMLKKAGLPGSSQIPAPHAWRSLLALKLFGNARPSHVMSSVFDEGLALFAGLNVIPKRAFLTEYSCRVNPDCYPKLMRSWFDECAKLGLDQGHSFDLDFHTIPSHGEDALLEKHYISKRSRRQKGILAFLAEDAETRVFCYGNAAVRKDQQNDEVLRFVEYWRKRTGRVPQELVFDSKLTTYPNLSKLNLLGINFITLRRRSQQMLQAIHQEQLSAWRRIELDGVSRAYKTPRILDQKIELTGYEGVIRQITIADLGHEEPTVMLTNQLRRSPARLITRYAQRMIIENGIADGIDFFHIDALSSSVALKVTCDLQLTLMGSSLYRLLGKKIGKGYDTANSRHIFRDFVDAPAQISLTDKEIQVRFYKRAHNPLLLAAGFADTDVPIPWLDNKHLRFIFE